MKRYALTAVALTLPIFAQTHSHNHGAGEHCHVCDKPSEEAVFTPFFSTAVAVGGSTGDEHVFEGGNHHDPIYDGFNVQGVEAGASLKFNNIFAARAIYSALWDRNEAWDGHWEEAHASINLSPALSVLAGRHFSGITSENVSHSHSRNFVEGALGHSRFFGEDNLRIDGVEIRYSWGEKSFASVGFGGAVESGHEHEEEEHDEEPRFHGDEGIYEGDVIHGRLQQEFNGNRFGLFAASGDNGFDRNSNVVGVDWSRDIKLGGRDALVQAEVMRRSVQAVAEEDDSRGSFDELAIAASLAYQITGPYSLNARAEWLEGAEEAGLDERVRLAANITRHDELFGMAHSATRIQYNADFIDGGKMESTIWLQWVLEFGGH